MKKGLCALGIVFVVAFMGFLFFPKHLESELNIAKKSELVSRERGFVVVVPSFNNDAYFERNLDSIFSQEYKNYRVIYVEDASTDNTYSNVKEFIERHEMQDRFTLIHNEINRKALYNLYTAVHSCKNDEIVVLLDGDDWFANPYVLRDLNHYYENEDVWMTYGQYMRYPDSQMGMCAPVTKEFLRKGEMRANKWQYSHLRTFYAGLFKRIQLRDLIDGNNFFSSAWDLALMFPMMEMAREHVYFTPDVFYVYNYETPLTDAKIRLEQQEAIERKVRSMPVYQTLKLHPKTLFGEGDKADLVAFSYNRPMQLYAFLESVEKRVKGVRKVCVIYRDDPEFSEGYEEVKRAFSNVTFFRQPAENPKAHFKPLVMEAVFGKFGKGSNYIIFAVDDLIITDEIDLEKDIVNMQETGAYGVFYRLGEHLDYCYMVDKSQKVPHLLKINNGMNAWQFQSGEWDWNYPNALDLTLYNKKEIQKDLEKLKFTYPNDFESGWSKLADASKMGICYERAKMVNIPMNVTSQTQNPRNLQTFSAEELNLMFSAGLKIDIAPIYHITPRSAHEDIKPQFIPRE